MSRSTEKPEDELEERIHFSNVITTFQKYSQYSLTANHRRRKDLFALPIADQKLLEDLRYKKKLQDVDDAILANAKFLDQIISNPDIFGHDIESLGEEDVGQSKESSGNHDRDTKDHVAKQTQYRPTDFDMDKLRSTLKQFARDWSLEGKNERESSYKPMKEALLKHFSDVPSEEREHIRVLVPGVGLGRLAFDVASLGFTCQGNEFSHYMLLSSFFILNRTDAINKYIIYPYIHSFSNLPNRDAMLRSVSIPDILPSALPPTSNFSLVAGDFEEIYGAEDQDEEAPQSGLWHAILTCFFIDTAKNIVNYLRIIHRILAPGGVWINLGPLLWHFENNSTNDPSIELDLEEVKELARNIGFELSNEATIDTTYASNEHGMLSYMYRAAFWTATKKE